MRSRFMIVVVSLAVVLTALAQAPPRDQGQTVIRVTTRLVEVSVIVRDKNGPVSGLTKDDFTILDRGKERPVAFFSVTSTRDGKQAPPAPLPPNTFSNRIEPRETSGNITAVLLDTLNTPWTDVAYGRQELVRYLKTVQPQDRIAVYALGTRLRLLQGFTNDSQRLIDAVMRHRGPTFWDLPSMRQGETLAVEPPANPQSTDVNEILNWLMGAFYDRITVNRAATTTQAVEILASQLARIPGRKTLIWLSASFPLTIGLERPFEVMSPGSGLREHRMFTQEVNSATRALNNANVAIYPVDVRGLVTGFLPTGGSAAWGLFAPGIDTMREMARLTGGQAFYARNDIETGVRQAVEDAEVSYTLGFYPDAGDLDSKYHQVKVQVKRPGVQVRYRQGYVADPGTQPSVAERSATIADALQSPLDATEINLTARLVAVDPPQAGALRIALDIDVHDIALQADENRWTLDIVLAQWSAEGVTISTTSETLDMKIDPNRYGRFLDQGLSLAKNMEISPRAALLRVVVFDRATGHVGSLAMPVRP